MRLYLIAMLLVGWACAVHGSRCPNGFWLSGRSCYLFGVRRLTFLQSVLYCKDRSSELVRFETMHENYAVQHHLMELKHRKYYWIGLTDIEKEKEWRWNTCSGIGPITQVTDWHRGEPNNAGGHEDCVVMAFHAGFKWNDLPCTRKAYPMCERKVIKYGK